MLSKEGRLGLAVAVALVVAGIGGMGMGTPAAFAEDGWMPLFTYLGEEVAAWADALDDAPPVRLAVYVNHCLYSEEPQTFTDPMLIGAVLDALSRVSVEVGSDDRQVATGSDTHLDFYDVDGGKQAFVFQNGRLYRGMGTRDVALLTVRGLADVERLVLPGHLAEDLYRLMQEDQHQDGRSIFWDGVRLWRGRDDLDDPGVLDGRGGPYLSIPREVAGGVTLECPVWPGEVREDTPDRFMASDGRWYCCVERGDPDELADRYGYGEAYFPIALPRASAKALDSAYMGIFYDGRTRYIGYAFVFAQEDKAVAVAFGGIGNLSDVAVMADFLASSVRLP